MCTFPAGLARATGLREQTTRENKIFYYSDRNRTKNRTKAIGLVLAFTNNCSPFAELYRKSGGICTRWKKYLHKIFRFKLKWNLVPTQRLWAVKWEAIKLPVLTLTMAIWPEEKWLQSFKRGHCLLTTVIVQSNLALRNFLVIAKLFTNANLFTIY